MDTQLVELIGRQQLTSELPRAGLEVATPIRDRGIDLIAYSDIDERLTRFGSCPIQMKAAMAHSFSLAARERWNVCSLPQYKNRHAGCMTTIETCWQISKTGGEVIGVDDATITICG